VAVTTSFTLRRHAHRGIALRAEHHVLLHHPVVAVWREVAQMQHQRVLVAQTDPMGDAALLALGLALGQHGGRLGDLAERHAGAEKLDIRLHLRMRGSIQPALVVARGGPLRASSAKCRRNSRAPRSGRN
jgi:hypothetical protein